LFSELLSIKGDLFVKILDVAFLELNHELSDHVLCQILDRHTSFDLLIELKKSALGVGRVVKNALFAEIHEKLYKLVWSVLARFSVRDYEKMASFEYLALFVLDHFILSDYKGKTAIE